MVGKSFLAVPDSPGTHPQRSRIPSQLTSIRKPATAIRGGGRYIFWGQQTVSTDPLISAVTAVGAILSVSPFW